MKYGLDTSVVVRMLTFEKSAAKLAGTIVLTL